MTKFTPLIDGNNKTVLQWTMTTSSGEEVVKSVPRNLWRTESAWSEKEIHDFFDLSNLVVEKEDTKVEILEESELEIQEDSIENLTEELEEIEEHIEKKTFLEN
jgi:hypothetical protein